MNNAYKDNNAYSRNNIKDMTSAHRDSMRGGARDYYTPEKDISEYYKKEGGGARREGRGRFGSFLIQWPIQMLEQQAQQLATGKSDQVGENSSVITDVDFRWLGVQNLTTVMISLVSLFLAILFSIGVALASNKVLYAYLILFAFLFHSIIPGYFISKMKKYNVGELKTGRFIAIIRKSWMFYEVIYMATIIVLLYFKNRLDWIYLKSELLIKLASHIITKRFFYKFVDHIPVEYMSSILGQIVNGLIVMGIVYLFMIYFTSKKALKERQILRDALAKEYLRPAEIIKQKAKRR